MAVYHIESKEYLSPQGKGCGYKRKTYYWICTETDRISRDFTTRAEAERLMKHLQAWEEKA